MKWPDWFRTHEEKVQLLALAAGLPGVVAVFLIMYFEGYSAKVQWTIGLFVVGIWLGCAAAVRERVASPLRTLANLLEAMREGDYSIRARHNVPRTLVAIGEDALGDVMQQVNEMGTTLRAQRLGALEATALLRKVMEEIDVAIFAFDVEQRLRLINRAAQKLLNAPSERLLGQTAEEIGLAEILSVDSGQTVQRAFPGGTGRWSINRSMFREGGLPHQMLVVTDLTRPLREEELLAWQRIVRVLGHELNNSLTPIKSIAESLNSLVAREPLPEDWREDMRYGLQIISTRSEGLSRFMASYARLAKLPRPRLEPLAVEDWVCRVAALETRLKPRVDPGPSLIIQGDRDQLDQLLINLVRNAVEASLQNGASLENGASAVTLGWHRNGTQLEVDVLDEGPGIANPTNLFVPFFTTKPGGSGIGLVLSRQIAEAHGGSLTLENRDDRTGCHAKLVLPA
jgi:two-component system, NtrC family, nitrogen regulation sensor histidine kinase NtrY